MMMPVLDKIVRGALATLLAAMVLTVTWQIMSRYFLGDPSSWTEEVSRLLLIWLGILGASYAYREKAHLGLDILKTKLRPVRARQLSVLVDLVTMAFAAVVMVYGGAKLVAVTLELEQITAVTHLPMGYIYAVVPLSGVLFLVYGSVSIQHTLSHPLELQQVSSENGGNS